MTLLGHLTLFGQIWDWERRFAQGPGDGDFAPAPKPLAQVGRRKVELDPGMLPQRRAKPDKQGSRRIQPDDQGEENDFFESSTGRTMRGLFGLGVLAQR